MNIRTHVMAVLICLPLVSVAQVKVYTTTSEFIIGLSPDGTFAMGCTADNQLVRWTAAGSEAIGDPWPYSWFINRIPVAVANTGAIAGYDYNPFLNPPIGAPVGWVVAEPGPDWSHGSPDIGREVSLPGMEVKAISANGNWILGVGAKTMIFSRQDGTTVELGETSSYPLGVSNDGSVIAAAMNDQIVRWSSSGELIDSVTISSDVAICGLSPDGSVVAIPVAALAGELRYEPVDVSATGAVLLTGLDEAANRRYGFIYEAGALHALGEVDALYGFSDDGTRIFGRLVEGDGSAAFIAFDPSGAWTTELSLAPRLSTMPLAIPEPATGAALAGLVALGALAMRRRR